MARDIEEEVSKLLAEGDSEPDPPHSPDETVGLVVSLSLGQRFQTAVELECQVTTASAW